MGKDLSIPSGHLLPGNSRHPSAMDHYDMRRELLKRLLDDVYGGKQVIFAEACGVAATSVSRWFTDRKRIGEDLARDLEARLGLPRGSLVYPEGQTTLSLRDLRVAQAFRDADSTTKHATERVLQLTGEPIKRPTSRATGRRVLAS